MRMHAKLKNFLLSGDYVRQLFDASYLVLLRKFTLTEQLTYV